MNRGIPYVICDTDGRPVTANEAKMIIAERFTVPDEVRARRRSKKTGKAPQTTQTGRQTRGDLPRHNIIGQHPQHEQQVPRQRTA